MNLIPPTRAVRLEAVEMEGLITYLVFLGVAAVISAVFFIIYR